jgi:hypothetical protein
VTRVADTGVPDPEYEVAVAVFDRKQLAHLAIALINACDRMVISLGRATCPPKKLPMAHWHEMSNGLSIAATFSPRDK